MTRNRCAAQAHTSPRSAPPPLGRPIDRATGAACVQRSVVAYNGYPGCINRTNRRWATSLRRTGRRDRNGPHRYQKPKNRIRVSCALAHALPFCASVQNPSPCGFAHRQTLRTFVRVSSLRTSVRGRPHSLARTASRAPRDVAWMRTENFRSHRRSVNLRDAKPTNVLLFDIVNVQNWPAARALLGAVVPVARSLRSRSAAADHFFLFRLFLFAGLAQLEERRPRNAEVACSIHAAGTKTRQ